jgi:starch synthase
MLLLAHPTGNANVRAAARAFYSAGWLQELHSCICWNPDSLFTRALPLSLSAQLQRRSFRCIPLRLQHSHPWREAGRLISPGLPLPWLRRHEKGIFSIDSICRNFDQHVASRLPRLKGLQAVYAYEDAALFSFQASQALDLRCFYELPIGYWRAARAIFEEEREQQPDWASTLTGLNDSTGKLSRKDQELQLADAVLVPSDFVRSSLEKFNATSAPIFVVPFGSPLPSTESIDTLYSGPLRVLFVGSLGQRKGLSYLLDAVHTLGDKVSLTLIGKITSLDCKPLIAAIQRYNWIESLPNDQILAQMRKHDVLVLPSLFEGFALVICEALAQALPVIATVNSGATEAVCDGEHGYIVPIRDSFAIAERLGHLAANRDQLLAMRLACLRRARDLTWARYEEELRTVVGQFLT